MNARAYSSVKAASASDFMPARTGLLQRKCACGGTPGPTGECATCRRKRLSGGTLQTRLRVNQPGDRFEQEADRVTDQVMRMPEPGLQRQADEEEDLLQAKPLVQRRVTGGSGGQTAPPIVHDVLRSPGQPLEPSTRRFMESRFGHDFSRVRVHADGKAAASAQAVNARAYTVGQDVVFGQDEYAPSSQEGQRLLAHELTHAVQQTDGQQIRQLQRLAIPPRRRISPTPATVTINATILHGATDSASRDIGMTNRIFRRAGCGLRVALGIRQVLNAAATRAILGTDNQLEEPSGATVSAEERRLVSHNRTAGRLTAYYVPAFNPSKRGTSLQLPRHGVADSLLMGNSTAVDTFTHELGHILGRNPSHNSDPNNLMASGSIRNVGVDRVTATQCRAFRTATVYPSGGGAAAPPVPSLPKGDFPLPSSNIRVV